MIAAQAPQNRWRPFAAPLALLIGFMFLIASPWLFRNPPWQATWLACAGFAAFIGAIEPKTQLTVRVIATAIIVIGATLKLFFEYTQSASSGHPTGSIIGLWAAILGTGAVSLWLLPALLGKWGPPLFLVATFAGVGWIYASSHKVATAEEEYFSKEALFEITRVCLVPFFQKTPTIDWPPVVKQDNSYVAFGILPDGSTARFLGASYFGSTLDIRFTFDTDLVTTLRKHGVKPEVIKKVPSPKYGGYVNDPPGNVELDSIAQPHFVTLHFSATLRPPRS